MKLSVNDFGTDPDPCRLFIARQTQAAESFGQANLFKREPSAM